MNDLTPEDLLAALAGRLDETQLQAVNASLLSAPR